jgi:Zn-dependent protease with chaperone function
MDHFPARYHDGRTSTVLEVEVRVAHGQVLVCGEGLLLSFPTHALRFRPRLGTLPLSIELPDGGVLQAEFTAAAAVLPVPPRTGLAHRLESHLGMVWVALAGVALAGWFGYRDGVPWLAREVAYRLPPSLETELAQEGMKALDRMVFKPSKLRAERRDGLRTAFATLTREAGSDARLEFRDGGWVGANALALPGGVVVLTDELVELLANDDQIVAVLAHEVGHHQHRHGARHILQDSFVALGAMALLGDASNVGQLATTLPTVMLHTTYSRDFEREADRYAFDLLKRTGRSPKLLGEALGALEAQRDRAGRAGGCNVPNEEETPQKRDLGYLSTHPPTEERIRAAEEAAR